jgi:nicotinate phosphoribosyltransferase
MRKRMLHLATDFYQMSMSNVYICEGMQDSEAVFDVFIRKNPFKGGYTVFAGLEQVIEYLSNIHFEDTEIQMLKRNHPELSDNYLEYLRNFKFTGSLSSVEEGSIIFPQEPLLRITAPLIEAQFIETTILSIINHQTLIATKASRVVDAAAGDGVMEFGLRRAHGTEAGLYGARATIIGGCIGTSNVEAEHFWDLPAKGTMSHSFVMSFDSEIEAFRIFAKYNPNNLVLLVDTYDTLNSGVKNAIQVFNELKEEGTLGKEGIYGIRLDSGDLAYLSREARIMLDEAGFYDATITASSDLDEYLIQDLKLQGAKINMWGVGTKLITAYDNAALGGVYKLAQITKNNIKKDTIKISDAPEKVTNPGKKSIVRIYDKSTNKALADIIMLEGEIIDESKPLTIFHPIYTWKKRTLENYYVKQMHKEIFKDGKLVYQVPDILTSKQKLKDEKETFWAAVLRLKNPYEYHVDLSDGLWKLKKELLDK